MKKYIFCLLLIFCLLVNFESYGRTEKVEEFTFAPAAYLRFWENRLKNYWRYANEEKEKEIDPELSIIADEFHSYIEMLSEIIKLSGISDIEEISGKSIKYTDDGGNTSFKNNICIEYDDETRGFLRELFRELPKEKIPVLSENEQELKDIYLIKNNTLLAYDVPLNFNAVMKTDFKVSRFIKKIDAFSRKYLNMSAAELADCLTGVWGGLININKYTEGKNAGRFRLEFMFVVPDPGKKLFKNLGEYLVVNKAAVFKDKVLIWRTSSLLRNMFIISSDNFMIITSAPDDIVKLGDIAEKKEIDPVLKKLDVPLEADEKAFVFSSREFNAFVNILLFSKNHSLKFMEQFSGNDIFCTFEFDDDEVDMVQYSTAPFSLQLLAPFSFNMMAHYDAFVFERGRRKYIAHKIAEHGRKCLEDMKDYAVKLKAFKKKYGKYPNGINAEGLKKFALYAQIPADKFTVKTEKNDPVPFSRYYYWGENNASDRADFPLLCDRGNIHHNKIHVIFCDGSVREFELKNVRSAKRIVSFLHTVFNYDSASFAMLLKQAERLDNEKL